MSLINARSVSNKTVIINDYFYSRTLDFLFITDTWLTSGDLSPFSELVPSDCKFLNSPRSVGRGGGLASIFKQNFVCRMLATDVYSSFELQLFVLELDNPMATSVIYRPPKPHKDFINEFSDFFYFDRLLILGDFNIHVCCPNNLLAREFFSLIDSFDLAQLVNVPTHMHGHTLDLVLSHGLSVRDFAIDDHAISDHKPITFRVPTNINIARPTKAVHWSCTITLTTCTEFSTVFKEVCYDWSGADLIILIILILSLLIF